MRLYEISSLTKDQFEPKHRDNAKAVGKDFGQEDQEEIGHGMYATAFSTPQEPGTVRKIAGPMDRIKDDAYFLYVQMIANNDRMNNNPYFPKIFDIQVRRFYRKDYTGKANLGVEYSYAVDMERLLPFDSLSSDEALMLGNKMFYDFGVEHRIERRDNKAVSKINYRHELVDRIEDTFTLDVYSFSPSRLATIIKDKHYKQALMLIKGMIAKNEQMREDMHDENIMIRRGPGGPQVVITDPVQDV